MQEVRRIVQLCARVDSHLEPQRQLVLACSAFQNWSSLLLFAEEQGMGPLLYYHLSSAVITPPYSFLRGLKFLSLRHRQANILLMRSLSDVLSLFEKAGIPSLVVKGAALCNNVYPEIGLRPMRDIDLLLDKKNVFHAHKLLLNSGFYSSRIKIPEDHYHLMPLSKNVGGMKISIELHYGLFPKLPPFYTEFSFSELFSNGIDLEINNVRGRTLANEEMLWHIFQHGFHPPLTYESCKVISAADIIALVEQNVTTLNWEKIKEVYPHLFKSLPLFHYISPWSGKVQQHIKVKKKMTFTDIGEPYKGWPRQKFLDAVKEGNLINILKESIFPRRWWCMLYYSTGEKKLSMIWNRLVSHPIHLLRWVKISFRQKEE